MVSKHEASKTTSYNFFSFLGFEEANKAPTPLTAIKAAPKFLNHAIFSLLAPSKAV